MPFKFLFFIFYDEDLNERNMKNFVPFYNIEIFIYSFKNKKLDFFFIILSKLSFILCALANLINDVYALLCYIWITDQEHWHALVEKDIFLLFLSELMNQWIIQASLMSIKEGDVILSNPHLPRIGLLFDSPIFTGVTHMFDRSRDARN